MPDNQKDISNRGNKFLILIGGIEMRSIIKVFKMAYNNFKSNKRKMMSVCTSISLCLILMTFVYMLYQSIDIDKYISKFTDTDFTLASTDYFKMNYSTDSEKVEQGLINTLNDKVGFADGGALYYYADRFTCLIDAKDEKYDLNSGYYNEEGLAYLDLYGADEFTFNQMEVYDGEMNMDLLARGDYIVLGVDVDDNGKVFRQPDLKVGDKVRIIINDKAHEYEILCLVKMGVTNTVRYWSKIFSMYLLSDEYIKVSNDPDIMLYLFNVENSYTYEFERYLSDISNKNQNLKYGSKDILINEFDDMHQTILLVGGVLCIIIGLIGLVNFINVMITGIYSRKYELAIMQAIGLTKSQMIVLLGTEGILYTLVSFTFSMVLAVVLFSLFIGGLVNSIWFFTYKFSLIPILVTIPFLLIITFAVPYISFLVINRKSVIERVKRNY